MLNLDVLSTPHFDFGGEIGKVHQVEKALGDFFDAVVSGIALDEVTLRLTNALSQRRRAVPAFF